MSQKETILPETHYEHSQERKVEPSTVKQLIFACRKYMYSQRSIIKRTANRPTLSSLRVQTHLRLALLSQYARCQMGNLIAT